ncbi:hypothetical protein TNCT_659821 [Trichonephila clavata]|uniref:Peptidase A2 domain-containing protein n=1 Tax=Trichonephila clavata TaxID=2740835 RepID=A0A8X6FEI8_TRICU|nr:hypothetical protein TNCT_659821 [Trichonephila clavata]
MMRTLAKINSIIIEDRKLREQQEIGNRRFREQQEMALKQQEFEKEKERLDREFQLEKSRITKEVVTARISIPVSVPINTRNGIDDLQLVDIKCGQTSIKEVIDTGAQISVLREDLIVKDCGEGEGTIQIISAFGEKEIAALKLI